ncbi:MAG: ATP-binding protein [Sporichthyaceae bacterium]
MPGIEFRLLGAMELLIDGAPVQLPGPAERRLLALLLLSPGRTVPASTLVDRLWSESALPIDPLNALQLRVSKLRRALIEHDLDVVRRESSGYRVHVDPDTVDLHLFARQIHAARAETTRSGGPVPTALALYDEALRLWRDDPLGDFAGDPWATVETARLEQLRLAALNERAEIALALGRHADVVATLGPVVAGAPTQENLVGLLMTALYQGGRQADALDIFTCTRTVLDDELGLEPSAALRALYQRILRQDAALAAPGDQRPATTAEGDLRGPRTRDPGGGLPASASTLIGRDHDLQALADLLDHSRLVTLVGPGGAGKTALAIAAAHRAASGFEHSVRLVRLASIASPAQVALAVAEAVGVPLDGADPDARARDRTLAYLANKRLLLVLDNCEHVIDAVARFADSALAAAPGVVVLATSREALAIPGEVQYALGPLGVPPEGTPTAAVLTFAAVELFIERARAVRSDLDLDLVGLAAVAQICRQLDGLPLALELAAARTGSLAVTDVAARLDDRFGLLTVAPRTAEERQRTLRNTVEWSYDLLSETEQRVFRRLAIFRGGWTLSAAEAVAGGSEIPPGDMLDLLAALVARSMVVSEVGHPSRFRMLETLRHYGAERLAQDGELEQTASRHASHFRTVAERADVALRGGGQRDALRLLRQEHANVRTALTWLAAQEGRADDALSLAGALGLWWHLGRHLEGREVLRPLLHTLVSSNGEARARALQAVSLVERPRGCLVHPSPRCAQAAQQSLDLFTAAGDEPRAALSRVLLAVELLDGSEPEEFEHLLVAAEMQFDVAGDEWGHAVIAFVRLQNALLRGDQRRARATGRVARDAFRALDDPWGLSAVLYHLGWGLREFGEHAESVAVLEEAIDVALSAELYNTAQWALGDLGIALLYLNDYDEAELCFARAEAASAEIGDAAGAMLASYGRGARARIAGDPEGARPLFARAADGFRRLGTPGHAALAEAGLAWCDLAQSRVASAEDRYRDVHLVGESLGDAVLVALALEGTARIAAVRGERARAEAALAQAGQLRSAHGRPAAPHDRTELANVKAAGSATS